MTSFFSFKKYVVVLDTENGTIEQNLYKVEYGEPVEIDLKNDKGYVFDKVKNCTDYSYNNNKLIIKKVRKDLKCTIVFKKNTNEVSLEVENASIVGEFKQIVEYGNTATFQLEVDDKYHYLEVNCKNVNYDFESKKLTIDNVTDKLSCKVKFTDYVVVSFNTNGGSAIEDKKLLPNEKVTKPKDPVRSGYTFLGWYLNGEKYEFGKTINTSIELEAKWTRYFKVTLNYKKLNATSTVNSFLKSKTETVEESSQIKIPLNDYSYINISNVLGNCIGSSCASVSLNNISSKNKEVVINNLNSDISIDVVYDCNINTNGIGMFNITYNDLLCLQSAPTNNYFLFIDNSNSIDQDYNDRLDETMKNYNSMVHGLYEGSIFHIHRDDLSAKDYISSKYPSGNAYYLAFIKGNSHTIYSTLLGTRTSPEIIDFFNNICLGC